MHIRALTIRNGLLRRYGFSPVPVVQPSLQRVRCVAPCPCYAGFPIPDEIRAKLSIPDHVEEARRICVDEFIQEVLLPFIAADKELTALEVQRLALKHKQQFQKKHPQDFDGEFELLPATETALMRQLFYQKHYPEKVQSDQAQQIAALARQIRTLLDTFEEELYCI